MTDDERGRDAIGEARVGLIEVRAFLKARDPYFPVIAHVTRALDLLDRLQNEAIAAMREGEQKQEGEARAAGDDQPVTKRGEDGYEHDRLKAQRAEMERRERGKTAAGFINACTDLCKALCAQLEKRAEAAESLAHGRLDILNEKAEEAEREWVRAEHAESLAKAEREGRESEASAYRHEIAELKRTIGNREHGFQELHRINRQNIAERDEARRETAKLSAAMKQYLGCSDIDWQTLTTGWHQ